MINLNVIRLCPVCDSTNVKSFLKRKQVPVHQNFLFHDKESAINIIKDELALAVCKECGFIFNQSFDFSKMRYGKFYENTQDFSPLFEQHVNKMVKNLIFKKNVQNCTIVEIGCGQGSFLRKLVEIEKFGNIGYGFDPSYKGKNSEFNNRLKFKKKYYGPECADIKADVVICRHVIEHIPRPLELLASIRRALGEKSRVFFETPTVNWILQNQVIWDFFYEHCSYFNPNSIRTAFEIAGFSVKKVELIFGNQYMLIEANPANNNHLVTKEPKNTYEMALAFGNSERKNIEKWRRKLKKLSSKVAVWGGELKE